MSEQQNVVPVEAVEVLARVLANEALFEADMDGYGWDAEKDSIDHFMPTARKKAKKYLEAVAPHMMAEAWEQGEQAGVTNHASEEFPEVPAITNPYRTAK